LPDVRISGRRKRVLHGHIRRQRGNRFDQFQFSRLSASHAKVVMVQAISLMYMDKPSVTA